MHQKFDVTGMSCAACSAHVDKSVRGLDGVNDVNVNLLNNNMVVDFDEDKVSVNDIINAVIKGGYGASVYDGAKKKTPDDNKGAFLRLVASIALLVLLMYVSMGHMIGITPKIFHENPLLFALIQILLVIPIMILNFHYFTNGYRSMFNKSPNMDSLIAIGSSAAFIYGIFSVIMIAKGKIEYAHNLYFESSATILTLISLGKYFEKRAKGKTTKAIEMLMDLAPKTATVIRNGKEETISVEDVKIGDRVKVLAGSAIPLDGVIVEGFGTVDESAITGESVPVDKSVGDSVVGATINRSGYFEFEVTRIGADTTLSQIVKLVEEASSSKAPISRLADKISGIFVPIVLVIALVTAVIWYLVTKDVSFALSMGISVIVISCPCALGLATPTAIMVGTGRGAQLGILIKSAQALETAHHIDTVVLDKTGTVTSGVMMVTDIISDYDRQEFIKTVASLQKLSEHPLSKAISAEYSQELYEATDFAQINGRGISGIVNGDKILSGNYNLMRDNGVTAPNLDEYSKAGKTVIYCAKDNEFYGAFAISDTIKEKSPVAIKALKDSGIDVVMLSGDNSLTANAVGKTAGIDTVIAGVLPQDKEKHIDRLQKDGHKVLMVGDGINDAPALVRADVGMAIGAGTDIAIESADFVLMKNELTGVVDALDLSRATIKNIKQNLFWAFFYNILLIPVAAGVLYPAFGIKLNPMIAAFAMSFSSVFVVSNALRLRLFKPRTYDLEDNGMKKTIKIEGMMCTHCTGRVSQALNAIDGVNAEVSLDNGGQAVITLTKDVSDDVLTNAVTDAGYKVVGIE